MQQLLIDLQYLPPISYFILLAQYDKVVLERGDSFNKSTYRNRCYIAGPNGALRLTIPVLGGKSHRIYYSDTQITYEQDWQKNHWQSLCSCYRSSPYFEFYEDRLAPFYEQRFTHLYEFNRELLMLMLDLLNLNIDISYTDEYHKTYSQADDYRDTILPDPRKAPQQTQINPPVYHQVFETKTGFLPNLSILDLLFNEGPNSRDFLNNQSLARRTV